MALGGPKQRTLLALLIVHAGEPVSRDALIDALWGERPPATAATALHGYVSQLRKALEPDRGAGDAPSVLVTREPGYALEVAPEQIDAERFRALAAAGRAAPDLHERAALLRDALGLWRGPALVDLAGEDGLAAAAARLEEERIAALEDRVDADLALGRHASLVGELEALVADEPLRERPRAQLILALYRCGRQADALAAYRDARRTLVEEVGIEPGPALRDLERRVLEQDASLDLVPRPSSAPAEPAAAPAAPAVAAPGGVTDLPRPHRSRRLGLALAALLAAVLVAAALLTAGDDEDSAARPVAVAGNSVAVIDPATNSVTASVPVGGTPTAIASGEGAVWVLNADDQTVSRIDPSTRAVKTFGTGGVPTDVAAGEGGLWVGNGRRGTTQYVGPTATSVSKFDPATNGLRTTVSLPRRRPEQLNSNADHLAIGAGAVWAVGPDYSVLRIDPGTGEIAGDAGPVRADAVAAGPAGVWARSGDSMLVRLDRVGPRIRIATSHLAGMAVGDDAVWATAPHEGKLWRVGSEAQPVAQPIAVGDGASAVAVGEDAVWVANALRGTVSRVDPESGKVTARIDVGGTPRRLAVAGDRIWVTVAGPALEDAPSDSGVQGLSASTCGKVFYGGGGEPDGLIVSDMPLRAGSAVPTPQMSDAIAYVLRERGFRAGRHRIGYQSCDDSTEQTGIFDEEKCAANAKAFVAEKRVLGEVGPYNSGCATAQLAAMPRTPIAVVGPTTTDTGLTRLAAGQTPVQLAALYPGGRRNFARIAPDEATQGAGGALEAKALGARRVYVLTDAGYGLQLAISFRRAARKLGIRVLKVRDWDPGRKSFKGLAGRVAAASPDAVYVAGLIDTNAGRVIADLRAALGPGVPVIAADGVLPISKLFAAAGPAARGVHVTYPGLTLASLPPAGRHFVAQFGATQPGGQVDAQAMYAAQAATVLLDAIGRSDGTRASVITELFRTRVTGGLVGDIRFDPHGDPVDRPITILRAKQPGGSDHVTSPEGATVERVVHPRPGLGG